MSTVPRRTSYGKGRSRQAPCPSPVGGASARSWLARFRRESQGGMAIEFAFVAVGLIVALIGIASYGRVLWIRNSLQNAANETARYAMVHTDATAQELTDYARAQAAPLNASYVATDVSWDTANSVTFLTIRTSYDARIDIPFLPEFSFTVLGRARVPQLS